MRKFICLLCVLGVLSFFGQNTITRKHQSTQQSQPQPKQKPVNKTDRTQKPVNETDQMQKIATLKFTIGDTFKDEMGVEYMNEDSYSRLIPFSDEIKDNLYLIRPVLK